MNDGATCSTPGMELEIARPDSGKRSFARDEPLQRENSYVFEGVLLFLIFANHVPCELQVYCSI